MSILHTPEFTPYIPAVLRHNSHGYVVEYYFHNPITSCNERRTIKLNRARKRYTCVRDFKEYVNTVICTLNAKLAGGWSPLGEAECTREYYPMSQIIDQYKEEKKAELSKTTMFAYNSFCDRLKTWLEINYPLCNCSLFNRVLAVKFLEHVWRGESAVKNKSRKITQRDDDHVTERTYNNNLKLGRALFTWCIEKCYAKENPFEKIRPKHEKRKQRTIIPKETREKIDNYFAQNNPAMRILGRLVYTSLLRPIEASRVRVGQINFDRHCIAMPPDQTKNGRERYSRMDAALESMLREYIAGAPSTDYLFGSNTWQCGSSPKNSHSFSKAWNAMREDLKLPMEYQLYSLRDSGIHDLLLDGVANLDVMHAAGHSDLKMTTRYADHIDDAMIARINNQASGF